MFRFWQRQPAILSSPVPVPLEPIGVVRSSLRQQGLPYDNSVEAEVTLRPDLAPALAGLEGFSHVTVVFWMDQVSREGRALRQTRPGATARMPVVGVFATRTQNRPNPVGVTTVKLLRVVEASVWVQGLDALDGTPVLDLRPYLPPYDAFPDATMPPWVLGTTTDLDARP